MFHELTGDPHDSSAVQSALRLQLRQAQVLLDRVEAKAPCSVLFPPPTSLQRVVCVMNQIHWV